MDYGPGMDSSPWNGLFHLEQWSPWNGIKIWNGLLPPGEVVPLEWFLPPTCAPPLCAIMWTNVMRYDIVWIDDETYLCASPVHR